MPRLADADLAAVQMAASRLASALDIADTDTMGARAFAPFRALCEPLSEAELVERWRALLVAVSARLGGPALDNSSAHGLYRSAFKPMALAACPRLRAVPRSPNTLHQHVLRLWKRASAAERG